MTSIDSQTESPVIPKTVSKLVFIQNPFTHLTDSTRHLLKRAVTTDDLEQALSDNNWAEIYYPGYESRNEANCFAVGKVAFPCSHASPLSSFLPSDAAQPFSYPYFFSLNPYRPVSAAEQGSYLTFLLVAVYLKLLAPKSSELLELLHILSNVKSWVRTIAVVMRCRIAHKASSGHLLVPPSFQPLQIPTVGSGHSLKQLL